MKTRALFCAIALLFLTACGSDNPVVSQSQILGTWTQESTNGIPLDPTVQTLTLTFNADGTFEIIIVTNPVSGNPITDTLQGTYFLSGFQLNTTFPDGSSESVSVSIDNGRMTFEDSFGNKTTYRR